MSDDAGVEVSQGPPPIWVDPADRIPEYLSDQIERVCGLVPAPVQDKSATAVVDGGDRVSNDPNWAES